MWVQYLIFIAITPALSKLLTKISSWGAFKNLRVKQLVFVYQQVYDINKMSFDLNWGEVFNFVTVLEQFANYIQFGWFLPGQL